MEIITTGDLASYLDDTSAVGPRGDLLVELANDLVSDAYGDATPIPSRVKAVTLEVAGRAFRNPGGYSSETVDDYTYRRDADTRQAGVYLTPSEAAELRTFTSPSVGAYSVPLGGPDVWLP